MFTFHITKDFKDFFNPTAVMSVSLLCFIELLDFKRTSWKVCLRTFVWFCQCLMRRILLCFRSVFTDERGWEKPGCDFRNNSQRRLCSYCKMGSAMYCSCHFIASIKNNMPWTTLIRPRRIIEFLVVLKIQERLSGPSVLMRRLKPTEVKSAPGSQEPQYSFLFLLPLAFVSCRF